MKHRLYHLVIFLFVFSNLNSQILDFSKKEQKIIPIEYDSSFFTIPYSPSMEEYAGFKNQKLVDSEGINWIITDYTINAEKGSSGLKLLRSHDQKTKTISQKEYQDYYFEAGFDKFKNGLLGVKFYAKIKRNTFFAAYNDQDILIKPNNKYEVTDVKYAKFENNNYAPIIEINKKGYYKLLSILNQSLVLKGNAANNRIEFTIRNNTYDRNSGGIFLEEETIEEELLEVEEPVLLPNYVSKSFIQRGDKRIGKDNFDDSGAGIFGRKIVKRNWRELFSLEGNVSQSNGNISVLVCVDRKGAVRYTEILFDETTETDSKKLKQAMKAAKGYRFQKDPNAPDEQCGKLIFNLGRKALSRG